MESLNEIKFTKTIKFTELVLNKRYNILHAIKVNSNFGKTVVVKIEDASLFLPRRYSTIISDEQINEFCSKKYSFIIKEFIVIKERTTPVLEFVLVDE